MRIFPIKVHYKVIARNLGTEIIRYEANADFEEATATKASRVVWEQRRSQYNRILCTGGLVRSENEARILYTVETKALFRV